MIESMESLHHAIDTLAKGLTVDQIKAKLNDKQDMLRILGTLYRKYNRSTDSAKKFVFTGFHRFTFAEKQMIKMQRRAKLNINL